MKILEASFMLILDIISRQMMLRHPVSWLHGSIAVWQELGNTLQLGPIGIARRALNLRMLVDLEGFKQSSRVWLKRCSWLSRG